MFNKLIEKINSCENNVKYSEDIEGNYKSLIYSYPILKYGEERSLFKLYRRTNDTTFKDIIFKCHLRDVYDCCTDITGYKLDLVSEGNILMYELIDSFDYNMPYMDFSKYIKSRLTLFYKKMIDDNNNSLDTKMSTHELARLEELGKSFTELHKDNNISKEENYYDKLSKLKIKRLIPEKEEKYSLKDYSAIMTDKLFKNKSLVLKKKYDALKIINDLYKNKRN